MLNYFFFIYAVYLQFPAKYYVYLHGQTFEPRILLNSLDIANCQTDLKINDNGYMYIHYTKSQGYLISLTFFV